jgi:hypothetical protein
MWQPSCSNHIFWEHQRRISAVGKFPCTPQELSALPANVSRRSFSNMRGVTAVVYVTQNFLSTLNRRLKHFSRTFLLLISIFLQVHISPQLKIGFNMHNRNVTMLVFVLRTSKNRTQARGICTDHSFIQDWCVIHIQIATTRFDLETWWACWNLNT